MTREERCDYATVEVHGIDRRLESLEIRYKEIINSIIERGQILLAQAEKDFRKETGIDDPERALRVPNHASPVRHELEYYAREADEAFAMARICVRERELHLAVIAALYPESA